MLPWHFLSPVIQLHVILSFQSKVNFVSKAFSTFLYKYLQSLLISTVMFKKDRMLLIKFTHESTPSLRNSYASAKSLLCVVFQCIKYLNICAKI